VKAPKLGMVKRPGGADLSTKRQQQIERQVAEQRKWMERCGGSRAGYIASYGSASDPEHTGDGGEAIWEADCAHLGSLLAMLDASPRRR